MATLAVDTPRVYELGDLNSFPVIAADIIYEGAAVGLDGSGDARPLTAGDKFVGFCIQNTDNSTGAAGAVRVQVKTHGEIQLAVGSAAATDVGKAVYASDDNTFVLTASTNSFIGVIKRWVSSGVAIVAFDVRGGGILTALTDNSGGSANDTLETCGAAVTGVDGSGSNAASKADVDTRLTAIKNNFADLAAKVNAIIKLIS